MFNQFGSKFRQKISQFFPQKPDKEGENSQPVKNTPQPITYLASDYCKKFKQKLQLPPSVIAFSQTAVNSLKRASLVRHHPKFWLLFGITMGTSSSAIALGYTIYQVESSITESVEEVFTYARPETLSIKSADGEILEEVGPVTHEKLKIWQIPDTIIEAFIASEDHRFESHQGVDPQGIFRAMFSNLKAGEVVEGGSTITQQLARIVFLNQERSITRKLKEMRLAQKIEANLSKNQILEQYLNLVYLGSGAYGVADAAWVYFGKTADKLTIPEAATLAGIVPAPSLYSPLENLNAATERRNIVLQRMIDQKLITPEEGKTAIASSIALKPQKPKRLERKAPYFTDYVQAELPKYVPPEILKQGGITVETTLNSQWQVAAEKAIETAVTRYGRWQGFKQAALTAVDPRNGQIKVMVGGNDYENYQYNRVTQAKRQPGSTFKPFVYATAIAAGFSPYRSFNDSPYVIDGYRPENYGDKYSGVPVSIRQALASSLNVVAVQVLVKVGWNPIIKVAQAMGIQSELKPTYSLALGAWEVNLLELTNAYGTFANNGIHQPAYGISRVRDRQGNVLYQAKFSPKEALDPDSTAIMTWMMRGVVTSGTGTPAQLSDRPVAGKTGTSDQARDLWFVGYIPQLTAGVWLGNDNNKPTWGASSTAAMIWREFMVEAVKGTPVESFSPVPSLNGRKATIKAEPIKPKRIRYEVVTRYDSSEPTRASQSQEEPRYEERRSSTRRRRRRDTYSPPTEETTTTTTAPTRQTRRRRETAPVEPPPSAAIAPQPEPQTQAQPQPQPVAAPLPAPVLQKKPEPAAPAAEFVPPAPPVERKGE
ncbi:penicillin-binding protein, 1A family [Rippkaea orientalis PCC 8801]|uniref:Penicillin-binding protein, 1A family n=1 Tax=Rippkaea orientalis (strain PCC 8801 / RF-1) TaxID=41431 RepID=B7K3R2_RIPO1|nr:penicillin-binding protein 1A [Rippkaea orientalis]ACK65404.1 penicillin-binding protein, 1A family [Rippkaea orientalis PCC 8801]